MANTDPDRLPRSLGSKELIEDYDLAAATEQIFLARQQAGEVVADWLDYFRAQKALASEALLTRHGITYPPETTYGGRPRLGDEGLRTRVEDLPLRLASLYRTAEFCKREALAASANNEDPELYDLMAGGYREAAATIRRNGGYREQSITDAQLEQIRDELRSQLRAEMEAQPPMPATDAA